MCGIAGIVSKEQVQRDDILSMTSCLVHRGPDARNVLMNSTGTAALGHTRLSVLDLSTLANQPMSSSDGRYSIVFNGEVYNHKTLRVELLRLNSEISFVTHSDTEVILQGFIQWGSALCRKLEGMFAFAIYDKHAERLFLCRDGVGKKPLYYFHEDGLFAFASEIKSLLAHPVIRTRKGVHYEAIYSFLHVGYIPEPHTGYRSIRKFPSGNFAYVTNDTSIEVTSYRNPAHDPIEPDSASQDVLSKVRSTLTDAVAKRLIADVPLGAFLSGGTDSSLIVALAAQLKSDTPLKTFHVGFAGSQFDETTYAREVSRVLKTDHCEYVLAEEEAVNLLEQCLNHFDEPFADTSAIPTMLISGLARKEVTVALTGDGGDELFLGYGMYDWANRLDQRWLSLLQSPTSFVLRKFGSSRWKRIGYLLEKVKQSELRSHIFSQEQYLFSRSEIISMATRQAINFDSLNYDDPIGQNLSAAEKQALFDIQYYLKDDLLVKVDRASMFHGLECRSPFLDENVIALALGLPYSVKRKGNERKWILKQLLTAHLPKELVYRKKWGFSIPLVRWMKNELAYLIDHYLNETMVKEIGIVDYASVRKLKAAFSNGQDFLYNRLWVLIATHKWLHENAA